MTDSPDLFPADKPAPEPTRAKSRWLGGMHSVDNPLPERRLAVADSDLTTALAKVLSEHRFERHSVSEPGYLSWWGHCTGCGFESQRRDRNYVGWELDMRDDEAAHAADAVVAVLRERHEIRERTLVTTVEQLDALPFLSIVREQYGPAPVSGCDYGGVWERRTSGWHPIAGSLMPPGYERPRLPALLIWHPSWRVVDGRETPP